MHLKRGESFSVRKKDLLIQKWLDKRGSGGEGDILMISTRHNGEFEEV